MPENRPSSSETSEGQSGDTAGREGAGQNVYVACWGCSSPVALAAAHMSEDGHTICEKCAALFPVEAPRD
jgi:hypothetical protein